jgi:hypothetical protein
MTNDKNRGRPPIFPEEIGERPLFRMLVIIFLVLAFLTFKPWVHGIDGAGYYSWLRSFVIQGNVNTEDELRHFESIQQPDLQANVWKVKLRRSQDGQILNHFPVGSAVLWAPFFLVAHVLVLLANALGFTISADGYSWPYILLSTLGSILWAFLGLTLTFKIIAKRFGQFPAGMAVGTVWLATPLVFYMYFHPAMSHANDVFVNALFLFVWVGTCRERTWRGWLLLGLAAGLAALVRTQNGLLAVFPCIELTVHFVGQLKKRIWPALGTIVGWAAAFVGGTLIAFLPQMLVWKSVFGTYLLLNPQKASLGLGFKFPSILNALFSTNRGLFVWSPITLLGLCGIFLLLRRDRRLAALLLCNFTLQLCLIGSWIGWSGGFAFGPRFFLNCVPLFAIGLAALLLGLQRRFPRWALTILCGAFIFWNVGLVVQYVLQVIPRAGKVPLGQMVYNQFAVVPAKIIGLILRAASRN